MLPALFNNFVSLDDVFENFLTDRGVSVTTNYPKIDIHEDDKNIYLDAELAGFNKKDINLSIRDGVLTLSGERKTDEEKKDKNYYRRERFYGSFERRFNLPTDIDAQSIKAENKDGVLNIIIPKTEKKDNTVSIEVK
jgi:HSP20 family protein